MKNFSLLFTLLGVAIISIAVDYCNALLYYSIVM